jgi:hypothetical protein
MSTHVYVQTYSRSHAIIFMSDNIRTVLREVIRENGLSPRSCSSTIGTPSNAAFGRGC